MSKTSLIASCTAATTVAIALPGLFVAGPAIADDRPTNRPPVTYIDAGTLTIDSDFTVFMAKGVPDDVRRTALRRPPATSAATSGPPRQSFSHRASQGPLSPLGKRGESSCQIAASMGRRIATLAINAMQR